MTFAGRLPRAELPELLASAAVTVAKQRDLPFESYQVQQLDRRSYRVLLAGGDGRPPRLTPGREHSLHAGLREVLGRNVRLRIDAVEGIETAGLKARTVVNLSG